MDVPLVHLPKELLLKSLQCWLSQRDAMSSELFGWREISGEEAGEQHLLLNTYCDFFVLGCFRASRSNCRGKACVSLC